MASRIVTTHYRYKRPPKRLKAAAIEGPAVVRDPASGGRDTADKKGRRGSKEAAARVASAARTACAGTENSSTPATDDRKPAIVTARRPRASRFGDVPELAPEEHKRRGDAADALFRELVRRTGGKART